jgi:hypothetical protein
MTRLRALLAFAYDFVVGDDPLIAVVVVAALAVTAVVANGGTDAWWVMPCAVVAALGISLQRATRR